MTAGNDVATGDLSRIPGWKLRSRLLVAGRIPLLMGIVNVTPDSFSDGGQFFEPGRAVEHGLRLAAEGADLLDVGGMSTRPGSEPIDPREELRRILPVIVALARQTPTPISVDTHRAIVAAEALAAGAETINDVTALAGDPNMTALAAESGCGVCAMHMLGTPRTMQRNPRYEDVVAEVFAYLAGRRDALMAAGVAQARIALDPGLGFGKTTEHNLTLLRQIGRFHALGCPLLVGPSRKRFIREAIGQRDADRTAGTIGVALALARSGVQILRVHDVAAVRQALPRSLCAAGANKMSLNIAEILEGCKLFSAVQPRGFQRLAVMARLCKFRKGQTIFREGEDCPGVYVVGRGMVRVYKTGPGGKEHVLHIVAPGGTFAEAAAIGGFEVPASAEAIAATTCALLPAKGLPQTPCRRP